MSRGNVKIFQVFFVWRLVFGVFCLIVDWYLCFLICDYSLLFHRKNMSLDRNDIFIISLPFKEQFNAELQTPNKKTRQDSQH